MKFLKLLALFISLLSVNLSMALTDCQTDELGFAFKNCADQFIISNWGRGLPNTNRVIKLVQHNGTSSIVLCAEGTNTACTRTLAGSCSNGMSFTVFYLIDEQQCDITFENQNCAEEAIQTAERSWEWDDVTLDGEHYMGTDCGTNLYAAPRCTLKREVVNDPEGIRQVDGRNYIEFFVSPRKPVSNCANNDHPNNYRSELATRSWPAIHCLGTEQWMGWQYKFPRDYVVDPHSQFTIYQNHNGILDESPIFEFEIQSGEQSAPGGAPTTAGEIYLVNTGTSTRFPTGIIPVAGDEINVVVNVKYGIGSNGLLKVWMVKNGQVISTAPIFEQAGSTVNPEFPWGGNNKWGLYTHRWLNNTNTNGQMDIEQSASKNIIDRRLFMGALRIVSSAGTTNYFSEVSPTAIDLGGSPGNLDVDPISTIRSVMHKGDATESSGGAVNLVNENGLNLGGEEVGLRFWKGGGIQNSYFKNGVLKYFTPQIKEAYIQFYRKEASSNMDPVTLRIQAEVSNYSRPDKFLEETNNISNRKSEAISNSVSWTIGGQSGSEWCHDGFQYRSPDLSAMIQELIVPPKFLYNNTPFVFIISQESGSGTRIAHSQESNAALSPKLVIKYTFEGDEGDPVIRRKIINPGDPIPVDPIRLIKIASIKPNPFDRYLDIVLDRSMKGPDNHGKILITNAMGQPAYINHALVNDLMINTTSWPKGTYYIYANNNQYYDVEQVVKL